MMRKRIVTDEWEEVVVLTDVETFRRNVSTVIKSDNLPERNSSSSVAMNIADGELEEKHQGCE
jgi:hypothetical protein